MRGFPPLRFFFPSKKPAPLYRPAAAKAFAASGHVREAHMPGLITTLRAGGKPFGA
jgi:hypothetical protein